MNRADVLRELGLSPLWRLRREAAPAAATSEDIGSEDSAASPRDPSSQTSPRHPSSQTSPRDRSSQTSPRDRALQAPPADARQTRIATLALDALIDDIAVCTACGLCATRKRTVPGVGATDAQWLFVGEAPGAEEDEQGEPFVGAAGQLLDNMLAALGLARGDGVYIANVLKCRPPGNRAPEPLEVAACRPYLDRQIELIAPRLIVALGRSAACTLLDIDASVASLRHRVHRYRGAPLVVTYHPAYLLRNPADKAKTWEDLLFARRTMREALARPG